MTSSSTDKSAVRIGAISQLARVVRERGVDPSFVIKAAGLPEDFLKDAHRFSPISDICVLMQCAVEMTGDRALTVALAAKRDLRFLSDVGYLTGTAPDLHRSLSDMAAYISLHVKPMRVLLSDVEEKIRLRVSIDTPVLTDFQRRLATELALAHCYSGMLWVVGRKTQLEYVEMISRNHDNSKPFESYFGTKIRYNSEHDSLVFSRHKLNRHIKRRNEKRYDELAQSVKEQQELVSSLECDVRSTIFSILPGTCPTLEEVSRLITIEPRALQRKLKTNCGKTFQQILEEVRYQLARQYLSQTAMSVTDVSLALGYSNPANFSRAIKRISGLAPSQLRSSSESKKKRNRDAHSSTADV